MAYETLLQNKNGNLCVRRFMQDEFHLYCDRRTLVYNVLPFGQLHRRSKKVDENIIFREHFKMVNDHIKEMIRTTAEYVTLPFDLWNLCASYLDEFSSTMFAVCSLSYDYNRDPGRRHTLPSGLVCVI